MGSDACEPLLRAYLLYIFWVPFDLHESYFSRIPQTFSEIHLSKQGRALLLLVLPSHVGPCARLSSPGRLARLHWLDLEGGHSHPAPRPRRTLGPAFLDPSTMAGVFSVPNIQAHAADFLGPGVVSTFIQALETGFLVSQSLRFWSRADSEPPLIKFIVVFVTLVAL